MSTHSLRSQLSSHSLSDGDDLDDDHAAEPFADESDDARRDDPRLAGPERYDDEYGDPEADLDDDDAYADYYESFERRRSGRRRRTDRDTDEGLSHRRGRLTEDARRRTLERRAEAESAATALPDGADRWSTWDEGDRGPLPHPDWLVTVTEAVDHELGVLKTGKEAEVHLIERVELATGASCLLACKRYRSAEHRLFHRDAGYLEGRRMRRSREMRAIEGRTDFGRNLIAEQWAAAEFAALGRLWDLGLPVPYPVQRVGTELLTEFVGTADGTAAPRLAQLRPDLDALTSLWSSLTESMRVLAANGLTHGDLSAFNLLVHGGELVLIDLPQLVDVVANPEGPAYLARDVANVSTWFLTHGLPAELADADRLTEQLISAAGLGPRG
ncbi:RIO1 family regulatory kinase/ATPase domain-containing protein [Actinoalloteichus hymeniacidonis]|uniref:non-specific serine/threonine protein kinase n=1 Tax=Actinoalloteichus hymeniacidonis TaxID=340345 RepID=A0AAC9HNH5_9PSEU|nr:RIO1 family regulatory kinase/ATPase [Actinoalloteichus hymeniacidonis]AOS62637.1 RIO-type serine/threonine protein kinase [Actinoalloteichus hymeniacidonis]MBB5909331.1 RIO kinase 1 [Actinoalloteichus hymeniacidonis]